MLNRVIIIGRLTRDPEPRRTTTGTSVTSFTVASDDPYLKDENGNKRTIFMNCSCFAGCADTVARYTRKGSLVAVTGRLIQNKYTRRDGAVVTSTEINADSVTFLEPKGSNNNQNDYYGNGYKQDAQINEFQSQSGGDIESFNITEDDLPFN